MSNSLETISKLTGVPSSDMLDIWGKVKANHAALETCKRHEFSSLDNHKLGAKYTCKHCGGTADAVAVSWYQCGLEHGTPKPKNKGEVHSCDIPGCAVCDPCSEL